MLLSELIDELRELFLIFLILFQNSHVHLNLIEVCIFIAQSPDEPWWLHGPHSDTVVVLQLARCQVI